MKLLKLLNNLLVWTIGITLASAQVPQLISYQGKLLDGSGQPVVDGTYAMEFRFYDACSGGNLLLTDSHAAVQTADGIYSVLLGGGTLTPGTETSLFLVFQNNSTVCIGTKVGADTEMVPRQQVVSAAYALSAATASTVSGSSNALGYFEPDGTVLFAINTAEIGLDLSKLSQVVVPNSLGIENFAPGKISSVVYEWNNSTDDYIEFNPDAPVWGERTELTIELWAYKNSTNDRGVYGLGGGVCVAVCERIIFGDSEVEFWIGYFTGPDKLIVSHGLPNNGSLEWHYLVFTWKSGGEMRAYVNGQLLGSKPDLQNAPTPDSTLLGPARVGHNLQTGFLGRIDGFRVLLREMPADEVLARYNAFK